MKGGKKMIRRCPRLEDYPELIHHIQLFLPEKDAARTCILSKSWLHAWSTIPDLRFTKPMVSACEQQGINYSKVVDATLLRYLRDDIPIQGISLRIEVENQESASFVEKWIRLVAAKHCLKKLRLSIIGSFTFPDETLSGKNLNSIRVKGSKTWPSKIRAVCISSNTVIKCVSLRELFLMDVHICEDLLNHLLSTCTLLQTINLLNCTGWNTIKVKNLRFLSQLSVCSDKEYRILEIEDVPKLSLLSYGSNTERIPLPFITDSLTRLTQLRLVGLIMNDTFFKIIKSKFPFLECLTLDLSDWVFENFDITCVTTLKSLYLVSCDSMLIGIRVIAPKLEFFCYQGETMPSLLFPVAAPKGIELDLDLFHGPMIDHSFFHRMREPLTLSSEFDIKLTIRKFDMEMQLDGNFDFIARNVGRLSLETLYDDGSWEHSPFFDAFFLVCHPKLVVARPDFRFKDNISFYKLMVREVLEKKTKKWHWGDYLKGVKIKNPLSGKWEVLTDSLSSILEGSTTQVSCSIDFELNWSSPYINK